MFRTLTISILSVAAVATLNAGQIQLSGDGPGNSNVPGFGLTGNVYVNNPGQYIQPTPPSNCSGLQYYGSPCAPSSDGGSSAAQTAAKGNYDMQLFALATGLTNPAPDAALNIPNANGMIGSGFTSPSGAGQVEFDLMDAPNGSGGYSGSSLCNTCVDANFWRSASNAVDFAIPVGLANVDSVYTMLNDYWGINGSTNVTVSFCFAATSNGTCTAGQLVNVGLTQGQEISSAVICNAAGGGSCQASIGTTLTENNVINGVTVNTDTVYEAGYSSIPTSTPTGGANPSPFAGNTNGNVVLDDQQFLFNGIGTGQYLSYIQITDSNAATWNATTNSGASRFALSAITVDQAPEPASVLLFLAGLGAIGMSRLKRRRS